MRVIYYITELQQQSSYMSIVYFAGHQGSSQSDLCANTGFGSFKFPICGWLQKGQSHSHRTWSLAQSGSWGMLHVGLEHVGSPHAILHMLLSYQFYGT